ncbi:LysR family transcriptional regulator [Halomonas sp. Ps84H-12]|uniref:LysR family transcriptional regulator n=1 Tax=Halomonas sp. Ps84H-12 TaxID=2954501 RepID=UPI002097F65B|nr:LysR family transcriptional regulator [Halomonas sp. Ps84H-12]MCO7243947.1 LysR family transcriptional regulator [Halomonas sp. Ps84H-12]|tara:strand:- start:59 stop:952 length:894 start_codon:yes stop_codon:yes gene_type:complete
MHITTYKYFLTVSKVGSVRKAADILHISPSAISRQISCLEHNFKAKLIDRLASGIQLTEEGKILAHHMEKTIREIEIARSRIDEMNGTFSGTIHYATIEGVTKELLFPRIKEFKNSHENVRFSGKILGSDSVYDTIRSGEIDFGIVMDTKIPSDIEAIKYFDTRLSVVAPKSHPLATKKAIGLSELEGHEITILNHKFLTRQIIEVATKGLGIELNIRFELDSIEMIKHYIEGSNGVTILPHFCVVEKDHSANLKSIKINEDEMLKCFTIICKKPGRHLIRAASCFIDEICQFGTLA